MPPSHENFAESFASGVSESISSPISGAAELFGGPRQTAKPQDDSMSHSAGQMLGSAVVFTATTLAFRRFMPGAGKLAPILAGAVLGGAGETQNNTIGERLQNAALGAGTVSLLEFAPAGLNRIGVKGSVTQAGISGLAAGALNTQAESFIRTGHSADLASTLMGSGTWAGTGMAFAGGGKFLEARSSANSRARAQAQLDQHYIKLPGLEPGMQPLPTNTLNVGATSELAEGYKSAKHSVGRAEVLAKGYDGIEGRYGTVFSVTPDGKLLTANHVVSGALDVTVFDRDLRAHSARVVATNPSADLAVLQLKDPKSYRSFEPMKLGTSEVDTSSGPVIAYGHPNGWREMYAAPGVLLPSARPHMQMRFQMAAVEGLSGAPIKQGGAVQAVFVQGARSNMFEAHATPIGFGQKLIDLAYKLEQSAANDASFTPKPKLNLQLIQNFKVHDGSAAKANLEKLFGADFTTERKPDFFHSKVKTVELTGTTSGALTMKMQYLPSESRIVISPIALDGKPIPIERTWGDTALPIASSRLEVELGADGVPRRMVSYDDPAHILQQGFNYRGQDNYLATLHESRMPKWMQLLPPQLRFERIARRS